MAEGAISRASEGIQLDDLVCLGLRDATAPTLLFGSHARGDARPGSDVDVLQLAARGHAYGTGTLSVTGYRAQDLLAMARRGSLFVLHLRTDARLLYDVGGQLGAVLSAWHRPRSYNRLHQAVHAVSGALAVGEGEFSTNALGFIRLATFLARTELYARCAARAKPEFCTMRAATRCGVAEVGSILDRRRHTLASWARFVELRSMLCDALDVPCKNPYGSLDALVVHLDRSTPVGASLVLRTVLGASDIGYHMLPPDEVPW